MPLLAIALLAASPATAKAPPEAATEASTQAPAGAEEPAPDPCAGSTTPEIDRCAALGLDRARARLEKYLQAAEERAEGDGGAAVRLGMEASQKAFEAYAGIECSTVFEDWKDGTIRNLMYISCLTAMTDQRTHAVWQNWLQFMDSTPPVLPEPGPTE